MSRVGAPQIANLDLQVERSGGQVLVKLVGRITIDSSPRLRNQLLQVQNDAALERVTVDLNGVSYIDLSGIATFIEALRHARASRTRLLLLGLQEQPRYLLEVSGLLPLFEGADETYRGAPRKGQE